MPWLTRVCLDGGVRFSVLCGRLQRFLVSLFLKVEICVGGDCACCLYACMGCVCGWVLAEGWVQCVCWRRGGLGVECCGVYAWYVYCFCSFVYISRWDVLIVGYGKAGVWKWV